MTSFAFVLALALCLPACRAASSVKDKHPTDSERLPSSSSAPAPQPQQSPLVLENLLLWPLEGESGMERLAEALKQGLHMQALRESQFSGKGPMRLSDGRVLSFAYIRQRSGNIDIGVDESPCVNPDQTATLTKASLDPVYQDAHGVDHGRIYQALGNGMSVRFNTTPVSYRCVTSIHIRRVPSARAPTLESLLASARDGSSGWDKVSATLGSVFDLKTLPGESFSGKGPVRLSDGRVLSLVSINHPARQIDIGVAAEPCVPTVWATRIVGARLNPIFQDTHGVDRGQQYDATANGMLIRFNTTPVTYTCVASIHIYPAP